MNNTQKMEKAMRRQLARIFDRERIRRGLTIRDLAKKIGTSETQVRRTLGRDRTDTAGLSLATICKMCMGLEMRRLLFVEQEEANPKRRVLP